MKTSKIRVGRQVGKVRFPTRATHLQFVARQLQINVVITPFYDGALWAPGIMSDREHWTMLQHAGLLKICWTCFDPGSWTSARVCGAERHGEEKCRKY